MKAKSLSFKIILCLLCTAVILLLIFQLIRIQVREQVNLTTAYIAKTDILPRTCISESDIQEIQVSAGYLNENVVLDKKDIIGKYTDIQGKIPAGSLFYRSMLIEESKITDLSAALLKEGQCIFSMQVGSASSLSVSQRIDLFWQNDEMNGILVKNARILTIKDPQGINIDDEESTGIPYMMDLAVREADYGLLMQAKETGTLTYIVSSDAYDVDLEAALTEDDVLLEHVQNIIQKE